MQRADVYLAHQSKMVNMESTVHVKHDSISLIWYNSNLKTGHQQCFANYPSAPFISKCIMTYGTLKVFVPSWNTQYTVSSLAPFHSQSGAHSHKHTHILVSSFFSPLKWPDANELWTQAPHIHGTVGKRRGQRKTERERERERGLIQCQWIYSGRQVEW